MKVVDRLPGALELRSFALTSAGLVALLFGLLVPWVWGLEFRSWPWLVGAILCVWGIAAPLTLGWLYRGWMRFGVIMSKITTPLIMGFVFVFALLPTALFVRVILRRDPMARTIDKQADSYRVKSEKSDADSLRRPF